MSKAGKFYCDIDGDLSLGGQSMININNHNGILHHGDKDTQLTANSGNIYLRPYGYNNTNNQIIITPTALQGKLQALPRSWNGNDNTGGAGWYKICSHTISGYGNDHLVLMITDNYAQRSFGILNIEIRGNNGSLQCWDLKWLCRGTGINYDDAKIVISGTTWTLYVNRHTGQYGRLTATELINYNINGNITDISYYSSSTKESSPPTATTTSYDSIPNAYPVTLYNNSSGTTGTVTLSETAANFSYLEIYYCDNNSKQNRCIKVTQPNNKEITLDSVEPIEPLNVHIRTNYCKISGITISVTHYMYMSLAKDSNSNECQAFVIVENYNSIIKVVGYR